MLTIWSPMLAVGTGGAIFIRESPERSSPQPTLGILKIPELFVAGDVRLTSNVVAWTMESAVW